MQKQCFECGANFEITDADLEFYKKVSPKISDKVYKIPPPKFCVECREQRRLTYRNERILYKRKSSLSGKEIISFFHKNTPFPVYSHEEWWSDKWDPMNYGRDFDFSRSFFEQFYDMQNVVPRPPLVNNKAENSDYCNFSDGNKNCYLITSANWNEDCYYSFLMVKNKNAVDCIWCTESELVYECLDCRNCYNTTFSQNAENCMDSAFLFNCKSLKHCLFCANLNNKDYHILNKPATKEEYEKFLKYVQGSYSHYQQAIEKFQRLKTEYPIRRANNFISSENVSGYNIFNSNNITRGFDVYESEDCAYLHDGLKAKDCHDVCFFDGVELCYESTSLIGYGFRFTNFCRDSQNLIYCDSCHACKDCFGCIGLRNKQYAVFNKQYSKEEYEKIVPKIIEHMEKTPLRQGSEGQAVEWGEFFPAKNSIFAYNETLANDYFPLSKQKIIENGWNWYEKETKNYQKQTISIPDNIRDIDESICNEILACEKTGENYKIIKPELDFYKKMQLPIPRKHQNTRNQERINIRNPRKLWDRKCEKCNKDIETSYDPERLEKIYCETCYLKEIY